VEWLVLLPLSLPLLLLLVLALSWMCAVSKGW
jgi:hypothetical protein